MLAQAHTPHGTIRAFKPAVGAAGTHPASTLLLPPRVMTSSKPRKFIILGTTLDGKTFRPSDWAERLAGAMASFRPGGAQGGIGAYIGYSPYCVPHVEGVVKAVIVDEALRGIEPMAWDFVMNFARDNALQINELPPAAPAQ